MEETKHDDPVIRALLHSRRIAAQAQAQGLLPTHRISVDLANQAVAVGKYANQGYVETAALVDADGAQQAVLRGDRTGAHTLDNAFSKGLTAASFKTNTSALVERSKSHLELANLFKLLHPLPLAGGIVITAGDEVVGAIGAAGAPGGDLGDACAHAGLETIKDQLK